MMNLGDFTTSETIYVPLATYDSNGASVTITGLAVGDIEIYKDGSTTQRSSDAGYALLDTDGIDFDGATGIHGFSIDLSDNTDAGFYADGSQYWIVVNAITVDSQTVRVVYYFTVGRYLKPTTAGRTLDVASTGEGGVDFGNVTGTLTQANVGWVDSNSRVDVGSWLGTAVTLSGTTAKPQVDVDSIDDDATAADNLELDYDGTGYNKSNSTIGVCSANTDMRGTDNALLASDTGSGFTAIPWNATWDAEVQSEANDALVALGLDHLVSASVAGTDVTDNSIIAKLVSSAVTADWDTFVNTDDSLQAIRDRGDAAWTTGSGSGLTALASGTAQGGTASTIQLAAGESFADDELNGNIVKIHTGTGAGQSRLITDYTGSTDTASITPNWTTNPDATSQYEVVEGPYVLSDFAPFAGGNVDAAITTRSSHDAAAVWTSGTRTLTAATNITSDGSAITMSSSGVVGTVNLVNTTTAVTNDVGITATAVDNIWDEVITGAQHNTQSSAARFLREAAETVSVRTSTAQAGASTTITLDSNASATDDIYNRERIAIIEGTGVGQGRIITDYNGTTKVATVHRAWDVNPDNTSVFAITPADADLATVLGLTTAVDNLAADYDGTGYNKSNSTIGTVTANTDMRGTNSALLASSAPTNFGDLAITASTGRVTVGTNQDKTGYALSSTGLDSVTLPADLITATSIAASALDGKGDWATAANVNTEVMDVLNTDTFGEPGQEAPGASTTLVDKIGYLYKAWRNKSTQTSTTYSLYADDASTVDQKATVSDDGSVFTRAELGTGP